MTMRRYPYLLALLASTSAYALPPGGEIDLKLRQGANHHIGDASFIAKFGRPPTTHDSERVRMTTHLQHVHDWLASRPATRPELAAKRAEIVKALEVYIAKGTTPRNLDLPWRTPVFIDEEGTICAVGFLIQSTAGRALPEKIAKLHRYDFIEDIARDMPEVQQWIADSGLTLEEIQTIQPAYEEPEVNRWHSWDLVKFRPADGPSKRYGIGSFKAGSMTGDWKVIGEGDAIVGKGRMTRGTGEWTSFYETGEKLAEGRYVANEPEGPWRMFHRSGNLAAEGVFAHGMRVGAWHFYYDTPTKTPIAIGTFAGDGSVAGTWRHFDTDGKLLARSWTETPSQWGDDDFGVNGGEGSVLDVVPDRDGIHHAIHQGTPGKGVEMNEFSLDAYWRGGETLFISRALGTETWYDASGAKLIHADDGSWTASNCHWSQTRKAIAHAHDVARLDGVLSNAALGRARAQPGRQKYDALEDDGPTCSDMIVLSPERGEQLDALLASRDKIRAATPAMVRDLILGQEDDVAPQTDEARLEQDDLAHMLAGSMAMYIEWPHIDRRFREVYATMAGRYVKDWANRTATDGDPSLED